MGKFKGITHVLAIAAAAVMGFIATPAGQALVQQNRIIAAIVGVLGALGLTYHNPKSQ